MKMLIRMAEIGMVMHRSCEKFALALKVCIPLIQVEQKGKGHVKEVWPHRGLERW
jgi:hypothetical protein